MQTRNDNPNIANFNFAVDSVFNAPIKVPSGTVPIPQNEFLLLDDTDFRLLDGTNFLLLGT